MDKSIEEFKYGMDWLMAGELEKAFEFFKSSFEGHGGIETKTMTEDKEEI